MRTLFRLIAVFQVLLALGHGIAAAQPAEKAKLKLLIVDGMNNHDWPRATSILKEILVGSGLFTVDVSTSPTAAAPKEAWEKWRPDFKKHDVVLSNFNGGHTPKGSVRLPAGLEEAVVVGENVMNGDVVEALEDELEKAIARVVRRLAKERKLNAPSSDQTYHWMAKAAVAILEAVAEQ